MGDVRKRIERPSVVAGYDQWAATYDRTPNPLVSLDRRYTLDLLAARADERVLDAACGTGANLRRLLGSGARPVGLDLSGGMLAVAHRHAPRVPLACADLDAPLPLSARSFDAVLCGLVGEHLRNPATFVRQAHATLRPGGRLVFSVFHPVLAAAGIEANFATGDVEVRLGAERHSVDDYLGAFQDAGFDAIARHDFYGDARLAREVDKRGKYLGQPLLLVVEGARAA